MCLFLTHDGFFFINFFNMMSAWFLFSKNFLFVQFNFNSSIFNVEIFFLTFFIHFILFYFAHFFFDNNFNPWHFIQSCTFTNNGNSIRGNIHLSLVLVLTIWNLTTFFGQKTKKKDNTKKKRKYFPNLKKKQRFKFLQNYCFYFLSLSW